jgi:hypothetical protein
MGRNHMSEIIDGAYLSPKEKRAEVEKGNTVKYPWAGNLKSLQFNASDIMLGSSAKYVIDIDYAPGYLEQSDLVHTAWIKPLNVLPPSDQPVTSELIIIPDHAE